MYNNIIHIDDYLQSHYSVYYCFISPLGVADCIGPDASHEFNGLRLRHFLDGNLALSNSIDEHGRAGTCRHVGTF